MYAKIETERLNYLRFNQQKLRREEYIHLRDAVHNDGNLNDIGQLVILPSSHIGSPRHMHEYAQDGMTYVRRDGRPDLFITYTCNPQWKEIRDHLLLGQRPIDRHDITARVFRQKLRSLMDFIVKHKVFGGVRCWMYSIEWQKRGLPHAHILIWFVTKITTDQIDIVVSAEIPDKTLDPELFEIVTKNMIHGPCGVLNPQSQCMIDGNCSKRFPKELVQQTITGHDGYPLYRRRAINDSGQSFRLRVNNQEIEIDNRWIVPYSPLLSKTFKAHINVEICNSVKSIKYICKYINKGSDMAVFGVPNQNKNDEIDQYQMGRYISSNEAVWHIFSFPIHDRYPTVLHLSVHLENGQRVYYTPENAEVRAESPPETTLTAFFNLSSSDQFARTLLYSEVPQYYTWQASNKNFQKRKQGNRVDGHIDIFQTDAIGRIYTVHPNTEECYFLRLLLINVRGPTSFADLRTVDGYLCPTYREACRRLNLLEDDQHWNNTLQDAALAANPYQMRTLFAIIISACSPSNPRELWANHCDHLSEDILHTVRRLRMNPQLDFTPEIHNEALIMIEDLCLAMSNKLLSQVGMISPDRAMHGTFNLDLDRERNYDANTLDQYVQRNVPLLNEKQKEAYFKIMDEVSAGNGGFYFLDAPGGTGKTFLLSLFLAAVRMNKDIALALASSGIAATLLDGGRTAHSALKLPLNVHILELPTCNISKRSGMAKVLQQCKLIIWDECTMAHKKSLEAFNRTLQDLRGNNRLFGGALVLFAGDFRQTLPVIPRSTAADELNASLKSSTLWKYVKTLSLNENVRVLLQNDPTAAEFSKQLLKIGNGELPLDIDGQITFPNNFCSLSESNAALIQSVFPNIVNNYQNYDWLSQRCILACTNKDVISINEEILNKIPGEIVIYKSIDTVTNPDEVVNYPTEFLNSLDLPGIPPHYLKLKVGIPIIMLRNLNHPRLCNGTRLVVKRLMKNLIEATILTGKFKGEHVLIPRIPMIPSDLAFEFKRLQLPVRVAFGMTVNKSQGQTLEICGIHLEHPVFSHGQLYVGCSRVAIKVAHTPP
ncbi:uncharacterized protein LOC129911312 [Episyrphus balteatus]|uniref:uncharacterized protein LOC129911312 n=1 Tax=Episyrphus balteatus TaxID=286459 RepID=UPI002484FB49|nr:uncharacterized protein LOC129911312 [Episyrphus balteatus]